MAVRTEYGDNPLYGAECLESECAWWYEDGRQCCILDLCLTMNTIDLSLQGIEESLRK